MGKILFVDLIDGEHRSFDYFRSLNDLDIECITNNDKMQSNEYDIVIIHGHGGNNNGKTVLSNFGACDVGQFNQTRLKYYNIHDISQMLSNIQSKYAVVLLACSSYSDELNELLNENCIVIIAPSIKIPEDSYDSRMTSIKNDLLVPLSKQAITESNINKIEEIVKYYNETVDIPDAFKLVKKIS